MTDRNAYAGEKLRRVVLENQRRLGRVRYQRTLYLRPDRHPYVVLVRSRFDSRFSNYACAESTATERGGVVDMPEVLLAS